MKINNIKGFIPTHKKQAFIIVVTLLCVVAIVICAVLGFKSSSNENGASQGYTVTYYDDIGSVLKIDKVQKDNASIPPVEAEMTYGNIFSKWDTDFSKVTSDLEIHPICDSIKGKKNVFSMPGAYVRTGETVSVSLSLSGDVLVSGFDMTVSYDTELLKLDTVYNADGDVYWNESKPGIVKINFASAKNTTSDIDICTLKLIAVGEVCETPITIDMKNVYANGDDESYYSPEYSIIPSTVFVYAEGGV